MIKHLDALRGLAALQVLAFHAIKFFVPTVVEHPETLPILRYLQFTPLPFLYDGGFAVYLFFVLSGYVLTEPFTRYASAPLAVIPSRWLRLAIPCASAAVLGGILSVVFPDQTQTLAAAMGKAGQSFSIGWWDAPNTIGDILDDAWRSTLLGYREASALHLFGQRSFPLAYNAALWTISVEFQGSMLILLLCICRRHAATWIVALIVATHVNGANLFICFIAGHILAVYRTAEDHPIIPRTMAWGLAAAAVALAIHGQDWLPGLPTKYYSAILFFFSVNQLIGIRQALARETVAGLGRWSFPIYLVHWPVLCFLGPWLCIDVFQSAGLVSRIAAAVSSVGISIVLAAAFLRIDAFAISTSRQLRDALRQRMNTAPPVPTARTVN